MSRFKTAAVAFCLAAYFLYCTWPGFLVGFDDDDVMNLHFAWKPPLGRVILANVVPFMSLYRPAGAAYYRLCYAVFGWNPTAFRAVTFGLLLVNIYLVYVLAKRLSNSAEIGVLSALVFSYHPKLRQIYMSNGAVYDVLCATLSLLALLYYMRLREKRASAKWWELLLLLALFIAALNAKEMAAILPAIFFVYECLYFPPVARTARGLADWLWKSGRVAASFALLSALAFWGKQRPGGVFFQQPLYAPSFTVSRFFQHQRGIIVDLFLLHYIPVNTVGVIGCYAALFLIAAIARKRYVWFAAWFALLAPLPVIFIPFRGFFVMYLPMAGWAIFIAALAVDGRNWLWRVLWKRPGIPEGAWQPERILVFAALAFVMTFYRNTDPTTSLTPPRNTDYIEATYRDIKKLDERIPRGAQILLLRCPYPDDSWGPMQMMDVLYQDRELFVSRPGMMKTAADKSSFANYDRVIDFNGHDLVVIYKRKGTEQTGRLPD